MRKRMADADLIFLGAVALLPYMMPTLRSWEKIGEQMEEALVIATDLLLVQKQCLKEAAGQRRARKRLTRKLR